MATERVGGKGVKEEKREGKKKGKKTEGEK